MLVSDAFSDIGWGEGRKTRMTAKHTWQVEVKRWGNVLLLRKKVRGKRMGEK